MAKALDVRSCPIHERLELRVDDESAEWVWKKIVPVSAAHACVICECASGCVYAPHAGSGFKVLSYPWANEDGYHICLDSVVFVSLSPFVSHRLRFTFVQEFIRQLFAAFRSYRYLAFMENVGQ